MSTEISRQERDKLIERARQMRKEPTHAEALLWERLRKRQLGGLKFRRQHIIEHFIVDFYCPRARLVIEVDGDVHAQQADYDRERDQVLSELGYAVVRFTNQDLEEDVEEHDGLVAASIYDLCMRRIEMIGG